MTTMVELAVDLLEHVRKQVECGELVIEYVGNEIVLKPGVGSGRREIIDHSTALVDLCKNVALSCPDDVAKILDEIAGVDKVQNDMVVIEPKTPAIENSKAYIDQQKVVHKLATEKDKLWNRSVKTLDVLKALPGEKAKLENQVATLQKELNKAKDSTAPKPKK